MTFIMVVPFEERGCQGLRRIREEYNGPIDAYAASLSSDEFEPISWAHSDVQPIISKIDRLDSRSLFHWVNMIVESCHENVVVDITCMPRELIGILLAAFAKNQSRFSTLRLWYWSPGDKDDEGYASQRSSLKLSDRWLSKGVVSIRSIVGFPGNHEPGRQRVLLAMCGHEFDRMKAAIEYLEPSVLLIGGGVAESSTVKGATELSDVYMMELRNTIPVPEIRSLEFFPNSVQRTTESLRPILAEFQNSNCLLVSMNSKLSFVGSVLACIQQSHARIMNVVPRLYSKRYSVGVGSFTELEVLDDLIRMVSTRN